MDNGDSVEYVDSETFAELAALHLECSKHPKGKTLWSRYATVRSSSAGTASEAVRTRMCEESAWKSKSHTQEDSLSFLCTVTSTEVQSYPNTAVADCPPATAAANPRQATAKTRGNISAHTHVYPTCARATDDRAAFS